MKKFLIIVFFEIFLFSCSPYDSPELPGNYYLNLRDKSILSHNSLSSKNIYAIIVDYSFNNDFIIAKQSPRRSKFKDRLSDMLYDRFKAYLEYKHNPEILKDHMYINYKEVEIENDTANYNLFMSYNIAKDNEARNMDFSVRIADSLMNFDPYYVRILASDKNYWIIKIKPNELIGPLTEREYLEKKAELHIPANLKLDFEE